MSLLKTYENLKQESRNDRNSRRCIKLCEFNNLIKRYSIDLTLGSTSTNSTTKQYRVLDLGCGRGGDVMKFYHRAQTLDCQLYYIGIDVSPKSIKSAQSRLTHNAQLSKLEKSQIHFVCSDFNQDALVECQGQKFNVINLQFCLHYCDNIKELFNKILPLLHDNGRILITMLDWTHIDMFCKTGMFRNDICFIEKLPRSHMNATIPTSTPSSTSRTSATMSTTSITSTQQNGKEQCKFQLDDRVDDVENIIRQSDLCDALSTFQQPSKYHLLTKSFRELAESTLLGREHLNESYKSLTLAERQVVQLYRLWIVQHRRK